VGYITFKHEYTVENYITFNIKVISGEFSGASSFCLSENSLKETVMVLNDIYTNLEGVY